MWLPGHLNEFSSFIQVGVISSDQLSQSTGEGYLAL